MIFKLKKYPTNCFSIFCLCVPMLVSLSIVTSASADLVGYWRLEEGPASGSAGTLSSEVGGSALDGIDDGSLRQTFSTDVPGASIYDPVSNSTVSNNFSLYSGASRTGGSNFKVDSAETDPASFTFELFVKSASLGSIGFQGIAAQNRTSNKHSWVLQNHTSSSIGRLQLRVDDASGVPSSVTGAGAFILDNNWHHVAVTYDGTVGSEVFELFYDYESKGTITQAICTIILQA